MFGLVLASGAVWWYLVRVLRADKLPLEYRERSPARYHPLIVATVAAWVAVQLSSRLMSEAAGHRLEPDLGQIVRSCVVAVVAWCLLLAVLSTTSRTGLSEYGIEIARWRQSLRNGAAAFLASVLPVSLLLLAMSPLRSKDSEHQFFKVLSAHMGLETVLWMALAVVVLAPLAEELIFRVALQGWLQTRYPPQWAIGITSVLFAFVHGWRDALPLLPLAAILGYVYWRTHDYFAAVVAHGLFNAMYLAFAIAREIVVEPAVTGIGW
jgi:membrane protease YdiL (CAAX protease family)